MSTTQNTESINPETLSSQAVAARAFPYLDSLNEEQKKAVEALDGPV